MTEAPSPPPANAPLQGDAILYTKNGFYWNISFPLALPLPGGSIATVLRPTRRSCGRSRSVSITCPGWVDGPTSTRAVSNRGDGWPASCATSWPSGPFRSLTTRGRQQERIRLSKSNQGK